MMEFLLSEMSSVDFDWLQRVGEVQELVTEQILIQPSQLHSQVYWILGGAFDVILPFQDLMNSKVPGQIPCGSWVGTVPDLQAYPSTATIQATTTCQILLVDPVQFADKLAQDAGFAARFYRIQAIWVTRQVQSLMKQFNLNPVMLHQVNLKEATSLFAELQDYHLDWLVAIGQRQQLACGSILQSMYRPIEALQIVLDGALSLGILPELPKNLSDIYSLVDQERIQEIARISRGDLFGELRSLQSSVVSIPMHLTQVQALRDTEILSIPYWRLSAKLLHDAEFAVCFYRTLAALMTSKYQTILTQLRFITDQETGEQTSDRLLAKVAKAEANFEWMAQRIQTKVVTGAEIQWSLK